MNPWTDLPQILIEELERTTEMFLVWFSKLSGFLQGKMVKIVIKTKLYLEYRVFYF